MLKRLKPYAFIFLILQTLLRISLIFRADAVHGVLNIISIMLRGLWFDLVTLSFFMIPVAAYHLLLPAKRHGGSVDGRTDKIMRFIFCYLMLFNVVAEHLFWTEFTTRFNFIAVDYLVYTQEVIGNITESYPLYWMLAGIAFAAAILCWISLKRYPLILDNAALNKKLETLSDLRGSSPTRRYASKARKETVSDDNLSPVYHFVGATGHIAPLKNRISAFSVLLAICGVLYFSSNVEQSNVDDNAEATEIAANGVYNLFNAFWNNEISYGQFYKTDADDVVGKRVRSLVLSNDNAKFISNNSQDLTRVVRSKDAEQRKNVILVVMESMSASYMGAFGNTQQLTPNLDSLSKAGVFFTNTYATGTRTVRGLEAVTLSIPPTPGQSILRRPENQNLFSLGFVFKDRGYDTKFIYGGYGYFDNMNTFFSGNGFDILDRTNMQKEEVNFANVWGVCDEDMFTRTIKEADKSYQNKKPFMHLVMTTSNHRPYTYPEGRIDISSKSGRLGGVKYADYSVGKLIADAKTRPWFKDTIFIFVADHTAGAGGKAELDPRKYHIPMIFYAPYILKPERVTQLSSQIDLPVTLLGALDFSYYSRFYGRDLLSKDTSVPRTFISNFQKVALVKGGDITVLAPKRRVEQYIWPEMTAAESIDAEKVSDAVAYYQSASWWREKYKRIPTVIVKSE